MKYVIITTEDQRNAIEGELRAIEQEHFRLSTVNPTGATVGAPGTANPDVASRIETLEADAERLRGELAKLKD